MLKTEIHNILVPVTLDSEGVNAIKQALCLRDQFYSHVTLFYVAPPKSMLFRQFRWLARQRYKIKAFLQFKHFVEAFFANDIPKFVKMKMEEGDLIKMLIRQIHLQKYDLIVVNKNLEQDPSEKERWEAAIKRVVGEAFCPVLTFSRVQCSRNVEKIMVPIDINRPHKHNVAWAIELARHYQTKVHLVSALNVKIEMEKSRIYKKIRTIERQINRFGITCETTVIHQIGESLHQLIIDCINNEKPDLVLILTHQEAILDSNYIGKLASEVIEKSQYPVFSITPRKETLITPLIEVMQTI